MILSLIAAVSDNNVMGRKNELPWRLPAELKYYRSQTIGKPNIMGRKTHEAIGRPLPKRRNIIVTRNPSYTAEGCDVVHTVEEAIEIAKNDNAEEAFVIGGAEIYKLAFPLIDRLYLTRVHTTVDDGDTFFPAIDMSEWREVSRTEHAADAENTIPFTIFVYERVKK